MDTISSRESNSSLLPMAGVIVGAFALIFAIVALVKLSSANKEISDLKGISARVDSLESQVGNLGQMAQVANDTKAYSLNLAKGTQDGFNAIRDQVTQINARIDKIETARGPVRGPGGPGGARGPAEAPVAGPGEYVVKSGDTGVTIARANGVSLQALMAVNPDVNWSRMHVGQKVKLPARRGAAAQPAAAPAPAQ